MQTAPQAALARNAPGADRPTILVLGLGNDILTDDAIGLKVVSALEASLGFCRGIEFRRTTEMGLALLDLLVGYEEAILIDSIQTGRATPGTVHVLDSGGLKRLAGATPHFVGVGETLALGRELAMPMPKRVTIFAIEVKDPFTLGEALTPELSFALPHIIERIRQYIAA